MSISKGNTYYQEDEDKPTDIPMHNFCNWHSKHQVLCQPSIYHLPILFHKT